MLYLIKFIFIFIIHLFIKKNFISYLRHVFSLIPNHHSLCSLNFPHFFLYFFLVYYTREFKKLQYFKKENMNERHFIDILL